MFDKYLQVEPPDNKVTVDFTGYCTVKIEVENPTKKGDLPTVWVKVIGLDDRATILLDEVRDIPPEDKRK